MLWILYVLIATILDALTDVASDHVIATADDEHEIGDEEMTVETEKEFESNLAMKNQIMSPCERWSGRRRKYMLAKVTSAEAISTNDDPSHVSIENGLLTKQRRKSHQDVIVLPPPVHTAGSERIRSRLWLDLCFWRIKAQTPLNNTSTGIDENLVGIVVQIKRRLYNHAQWLRRQFSLKQGQDHKQKLSSEQDLLCSCVAMGFVSLVIWSRSEWSLLPPLNNSRKKIPYFLSITAGILYALGMRSIMKAWELVPSTVVTPMMQLSGPMVEIIEACLGYIARNWFQRVPRVLNHVAQAQLSVRDAFAFLIICVGGLTPCIESLPQLLSFRAWRTPSMILLFLSNLFFSIYYILLSLCCVAVSSTLIESPKLELTEPLLSDLSLSVVSGRTGRHKHRKTSLMEEMQFVVISNLAAVVTLIFLFLITPELRRHAKNLEYTATTPKLVSIAAEFTNYLSMIALGLAYEHHYNSGLVTAARSALNQTTNVALALTLYSAFRIGRPVTALPRKLMSAALVSFGLFISIDSSFAAPIAS